MIPQPMTLLERSIGVSFRGGVGRAEPRRASATPARFHAARGMSPDRLQALMGWSDRSTPQKFIRLHTQLQPSHSVTPTILNSDMYPLRNAGVG